MLLLCNVELFNAIKAVVCDCIVYECIISKGVYNTDSVAPSYVDDMRKSYKHLLYNVVH